MPRVLIADKMSAAATQVFKNRGVDVDVITGLSKEELINIIADYDGLAIRSTTRPDAEIIAAATNLKVIGRAGIGTDNIDKMAATALIQIPRQTLQQIRRMRPPYDGATTRIIRWARYTCSNMSVVSTSMM